MKLVVLALAVAVAFAAPAQETPQLAESIEVRVTNVDVIVTDRSGKHITGLTSDDFEVFEGGKPQPISNFYEITAETKMDEVPPERNRRRIVVFVDNFTTTPLLRNHALQAFERSLDTLMRPEDEVMLVFWNEGMDVVTPLTSDRALLKTRFREAAKRSAGGTTLQFGKRTLLMLAKRLLDEANNAYTGRSHKEAYAMAVESARAHGETLWSAGTMMIDDMKSTITMLAGVEGKKAFIFIGAELPENPALELFEEIDSMFFYYIQNIIPAHLRDTERRLVLPMADLARHANANGVTMYMVDASDRARMADASNYEPNDMATVNQAEINTSRGLRQIAWSTGGIAIPTGKSFGSALQTVATDLSSYYSLGYRSPDGESDTRQISVKVKRAGLRVRTRDSYIRKSDSDQIRDRLIANVFHAGRIASDFEVTLDTGRIERKDNGRSLIPLVVTFPSSITLIPDAENNLAGEFEVSIVTGLETGALSRVSTRVHPLKFTPADKPRLDALKTFSFRAPLEVGKGPQIVSVAVTDKLAGTTGFARAVVSGD
jgi:VWFA-related protein